LSDELSYLAVTAMGRNLLVRAKGCCRRILPVPARSGGGRL